MPSPTSQRLKLDAKICLYLCCLHSLHDMSEFTFVNVSAIVASTARTLGDVDINVSKYFTVDPTSMGPYERSGFMRGTKLTPMR